MGHDVVSMLVCNGDIDVHHQANDVFELIEVIVPKWGKCRSDCRERSERERGVVHRYNPGQKCKVSSRFTASERDGLSTCWALHASTRSNTSTGKRVRTSVVPAGARVERFVAIAVWYSSHGNGSQVRKRHQLRGLEVRGARSPLMG